MCSSKSWEKLSERHNVMIEKEDTQLTRPWSEATDIVITDILLALSERQDSNKMFVPCQGYFQLYWSLWHGKLHSWNLWSRSANTGVASYTALVCMTVYRQVWNNGYIRSLPSHPILVCMYIHTDMYVHHQLSSLSWEDGKSSQLQSWSR